VACRDAATATDLEARTADLGASRHRHRARPR